MHDLELQRGASSGTQRVVIVGGGVVGTATALALAGVGHDVSVIEISPERRASLCARGLRVSAEPDRSLAGAIVLLCVPTPAGADGYDLAPLRVAATAVGRALREADPGTIVAVRSTVPPGTTTGLVTIELERASGQRQGVGFDVASTPEFLRAATAVQDAARPGMTVVGCADPHALARLVATFTPLGGVMRRFSEPAIAEAVKIVHNCFNAAKISFFNEVATLCDAVGIDGDLVAEVVVRSAEASTNLDYGTKSGRAFDGACLPKDLDGLIAFASEVDAVVPLLRAVRQVNRSMPEIG